jgi:hypothetical protein
MKKIKKLNTEALEEASQKIRDLTSKQPTDEFFAAVEATEDEFDQVIKAWQSNLEYQEKMMEIDIKQAIEDEKTQFEVDWNVNVDDMSKEEVKKTINIMHGFVKQHQHTVNNYNCNKNKKIEELQDLLTKYLDNSTIRSNKDLCEALGYKWGK